MDAIVMLVGTQGGCTMPNEQEIGRRVRDSIIGTIKGTGEITEVTVATLSSAVQRHSRRPARLAPARPTSPSAPSREPSARRVM